jgi:hypothetical protein
VANKEMFYDEERGEFAVTGSHQIAVKITGPFAL